MLVGVLVPVTVKGRTGVKQCPAARLCAARVHTDRFSLQVDMTWHGHHHSYQRTCALYKGECVPPNRDGSQAAPVHLVIGHAGAGLCLNVEEQQPDFFETVQLEHGYMRVEANATHLHCEVGCALTYSFDGIGKCVYQCSHAVRPARHAVAEDTACLTMSCQGLH